MAIDQAETVAQILAEQRENDAKFKTTEVFKEVEPGIDLGNLLLFDRQPVCSKELSNKQETFLCALARDNAQLIFNEIWKLPVKRIEDVVVVTLPEPATLLPREKPVPKLKPPTKWEIYAKKKGIEKKKRTRMLWDEEEGKYKPRHGYQRGNDKTKDWCIEVPVNSDPNEDQFAKKENEKKEKIAKNELQRLRNFAKTRKSVLGDTSNLQQPKPLPKIAKERVTKEIDVARISTASFGKFQETLPKEKLNKKTGKKRKFEPVVGSRSNEKKRTLEIWDKLNKPAKLDVTKAVNKVIATEQASAHAQKCKKGSGKVKNKRYRKGKQSTVDKMKGRTLGKGKKRK